jgi:hypothetical protein
MAVRVVPCRPDSTDGRPGLSNNRPFTTVELPDRPSHRVPSTTIEVLSTPITAPRISVKRKKYKIRSPRFEPLLPSTTRPARSTQDPVHLRLRPIPHNDDFPKKAAEKNCGMTS